MREYKTPELVVTEFETEAVMDIIGVSNGEIGGDVITPSKPGDAAGISLN